MLSAVMTVFPLREGYMEKCVMNNYFGIGLDAKISLEFNNKREEHPEKCRLDTFSVRPGISEPPSNRDSHRPSDRKEKVCEHFQSSRSWLSKEC